MPRRRARRVNGAVIVFALLVLATVAAFAWAQRVKRDPLVLDKVTFVPAPVLHSKHRPHGFTPNGDCHYDSERIRFRVTRSDHATVQVVKPSGRVVVTLARDRFLKRYHFFTFYWDGRQRGGGIAPAGRYKLRVKLLGQERTLVPPGSIHLHHAPPPADRLVRHRREKVALSDILAGAGLLAAAAACAVAILLPPGRARSAAMLLALALFPLLILGDQWHTQQIVDLRHSGARIAALLAIGVVAVAALTYLFRRWPVLLPLAIVAALPFRVPLHAGGDTANLLVPLYLVIAGGVLAVLLRDWTAGAREGRPRTEPVRPARRPPPPATPGSRAAVWLPRVLAAVVVLYGLQTLYSEDFSKGLQNMCFFLVPFTVAFALLQDVEWDNRLLRLVLYVIVAEALAFVLIGGVEYASRSLFWNDVVIRSNEFHTYFRVNSVFWDPNIYGRYLALVLVVVTTALLWAKAQARLLAAGGGDPRPLDRPRADLLAVELHRPAGRAGGPRGDPLELALDAGRGRDRGGRRGSGDRPDRRLGQDHPQPDQRRSQRPRQPRLRAGSTSSPNARSGAMAPAPSSTPTPTIARTRTSRSPSPTPSRSPSPPSRAWSAWSSTSP